MNNLAVLRESQLEREIAQLIRLLSDDTHSSNLRTKCAHAYRKELLRFKQESLDLLRYRRSGRRARWQRRPELH